MKVNCLSLNVYRAARRGDCTNGGISSQFNELLIACPTGPRSFDADKELPLNFCMVQRRRTWGDHEHVRIIPAAVNERGEIVPRGSFWWMFGGNIASTSDSRFHELTGIDYALDIHDRRE